MTTLNINVGFDAETIKNLAKLENAPIRFASHVMDGLGRSAEAVQGEAEVYMWGTFINPTVGGIADTLQNGIISPTQSQVWTEEPYGQRLEKGFSGMTDSLGRYYPYWPDYHWAEHAVAASVDQVQAIFWAELEVAANGE